MPTPIVMDVDTGIDDALAILYAVAHPDLDLLGITCVAGNAGLDQVVENTLKVLDAAGAPDIPVSAGAARPLVERGRRKGTFHGLDGLGGITLPSTGRSASPLPAPELLRLIVEGSPIAVTLVATAPQTNVAIFLTQHPHMASALAEIVFMGGSASRGNVTAVAEYNVWQDPEAASSVLESGLPCRMYGLDVFERLLVDRTVAERWLAADHRALRLAGELLFRRGTRTDGSANDYRGVIGDPGALVWLTDPHLFDSRPLPVRVNLDGLGRGQTIVDRRPTAQDAGTWADDPWPQVQVALDLRRRRAAARFVETIERYSSVGAE